MRLERKSVTESFVDYFRMQITAGKLHAGDELPTEKELMTFFDVGRFTVREGMARLSALGLITSSRGRRARVSGEITESVIYDALIPFKHVLNEDQAARLFEVRLILETNSAKLAAERATEVDIQELSSIMDQFSLTRNDPLRFASNDFDFHAKISEISDNHLLSIFLKSIHKWISSFILYNSIDHTIREMAIHDHSLIFDAIKKSSPSEAYLAMEKHLIRVNLERSLL